MRVSDIVCHRDRCELDHGDDGGRHRVHHRRGLGAAAGISALLDGDDRVRRHGKISGGIFL